MSEDAQPGVQRSVSLCVGSSHIRSYRVFSYPYLLSYPVLSRPILPVRIYQTLTTLAIYIIPYRIKPYFILSDRLESGLIVSFRLASYRLLSVSSPFRLTSPVP